MVKWLMVTLLVFAFSACTTTVRISETATPAVQPTNTPAPTPTPTATPSPTNTPTPVPTPTPNHGSWESAAHTDEFTGEQSAIILLESRDHNLEFPYENRAVDVAIICHPSRLSAMIGWAGKYVRGDDGVLDVEIRWDESPMVEEEWEDSRSGEVILAPSGNEFVAMAEKSETLRVRAWDFAYESHVATFQLQGLSVHLDKHSELCR